MEAVGKAMLKIVPEDYEALSLQLQREGRTAEDVDTLPHSYWKARYCSIFYTASMCFRCCYPYLYLLSAKKALIHLCLTGVGFLHTWAVFVPVLFAYQGVPMPSLDVSRF